MGSIQKYKKIKIHGRWRGEQERGRNYLWDDLTSHLPCNLALITRRLETSTNTPVITVARIIPTGMRDENAMKLGFTLLCLFFVCFVFFFFVILNQDMLLCC